MSFRKRSSLQIRKSKSSCATVLTGKRLFRAAARKIIVNLPVILQQESELTDKQPAKLQSLEKQKKRVPPEAKKILIKDYPNRTPEEIEALIGFLGHLTFFNQYPKKEYEQLIAKSVILIFNAGRVIIRQGQPTNSNSLLYNIISGNLTVEIETTDPVTLHKTSEIVKKLGPGDSFGESAILFNDLREATVTSTTPVQLIGIFKDDFDSILKDSLEKEWNKVRDSMKQLPYFFGDWGDVEARRCSIISSLKSFKDGDGLGREKEAHFIMEGRCSVVQNILIQQKKNGKFKLIPHDNSENSKPIGSDETYMQTSIFTKGACFGVGENREHRRYVAETDVICLMIPQYLLLAHKRFDSYKQYLESRLFSEQELFNSFVYLRNRLSYRQKVIEGYKGRASEINNTKIWDVPYYFRVLSPQIGLLKVPDSVVTKVSKLKLK